MQKVKNQISKFINSEWFPFAILLFLLLFFHACIHVGPGDDEYFKSILNNNNIFEWLILRYKSWSSRLVIEFFLAIIAGYPILWRLLNTAVIVLGTISVSKLFSYEKSTTINGIICALFLCLYIDNITGYIATALNYPWVAFLGIFSMIPIKKILNKEKVYWYEYIVYFFAMIYATNQEQMCCILLATYFVFTCYMFYLSRKLDWFFITSTVLNLASLIFIITCPGNTARKIGEVRSWFPDFNNISFFRKLEIGYSSTLFEFIMKPNFIFFIFVLLLFICVVVKCKNMFLRFIALIPLACNLIFGFLVNIVGEDFSRVIEVKNVMTPYGTGIKIFDIQTWIPDMILLLVCTTIVISLYVLFDDKNISVLTIFILLLGFGSRMIMSFSPTIWGSGQRTFTFMSLSILICSVILYQVLQGTKKITIEVLNYIILIITIMSVVNMITYKL